MNRERAWKESYVEHVLQGGEDGFREALRQRCAAALRVRRRVRAARAAAVAAALLLLATGAGIGIWKGRIRPPGEVDSVAGPNPDARPAYLVSSSPLSELQLVRTAGTVDIVRNSLEVDSLTDDDLLRSFEGRPIAMVRLGPDRQRLIFLDREGTGTPGAGGTPR